MIKIDLTFSITYNSLLCKFCKKKQGIGAGCKTAILKATSPSCGSGKIYDGTFSKKLIDGYGITAALLKQNGITIYSEESFAEISKK